MSEPMIVLEGLTKSYGKHRGIERIIGLAGLRRRNRGAAETAESRPLNGWFATTRTCHGHYLPSLVRKWCFEALCPYFRWVLHGEC